VTAALPTVVQELPCWHRVGVWGDQSCAELPAVTHCQNCPVFASAGRKFLDTASPPDYLDEWTARLAVPEAVDAGDVIGVLVFRLADEWLAIPVGALVEVTRLRTVHRIPHRGGLLAGLANLRGELHLCVRLDLLLGITARPADHESNRRLVVIRQGGEGWAFVADEVDQVQRVPARDVQPTAPTVSRAGARVTRGVFAVGNRSVGLLDDARVFQSLAERVR
jgi:chemotaxis-related protein WspD